MGMSYLDSWDVHKGDLTVWRRFWALWELRRKWKWADWFYGQLDRVEGQVVESKAWTLFPGPGYMKLCLWIAILRSIHEGITKNLDSFDTPKDQKMHPSKVLPVVPDNIKNFPAIRGTPFRDFRNAIFHCQWAPTLVKFEIDAGKTQEIENLHRAVGEWLDAEFRFAFETFKQKYQTPENWLFLSDGTEFMPETFY